MRIFELTDETTNPSRHPFRRAVMLLLLGLLSLMTIQCNGAQGEVEVESESVQLATACGEFDKMAPRVIYHTPRSLGFEWFKITYRKHDEVLLDDHDPNKSTDDAHARKAHDYARDADTFFRGLKAEGFGTWNGCYGNQDVPTMVSYVHQCFTSWQGDKVFYEDEDFDDMNVASAHEWTHAIHNKSTTDLNAQGHQDQNPPGQTGALYESLADTFAFLITGDKVDRENSVEHMDDYALLGDSNCPEPNSEPKCGMSQEKWLDVWEANLCKYSNIGIPNKAAYLLIEEEQHEYHGVSVTGIGRDKVARIYFHALNPDYIQPTADFEIFANGVVNACLNLQRNNQGGITPDNCDQVRNAFLAVGMLRPEGEVLAKPPPPTSPSPPTATPVPQLVKVVPSSKRGPRITVTNQSSQKIIVNQFQCNYIGGEINKNGLAVAWESDQVFVPGYSFESNNLKGNDWKGTLQGCDITINRDSANPIIINLVPEESKHYEITITDADLR